MQLSRVIQSLLFRDVVSYLLPGVFALTPVVLYDVFPELSARVTLSIQTVGPFAAAIGSLTCAYVVGYLISTVSYWSWEACAKLNPPSAVVTEDGLDGLASALCRDFGEAVEKRDAESDREYSDRLVAYCQSYVEACDREFFALNIERTHSMKNFEIGLSGALVVWIACLPVTLSWSQAAGPIAGALALSLYLHLRGSRFLDRAIDEAAVTAYLRLHHSQAQAHAGDSDQEVGGTDSAQHGGGGHRA